MWVHDEETGERGTTSAQHIYYSFITTAPNGFEPNQKVFDPLNWMLDRLVEFPYSVPGVSETLGIKQYSITFLKDGMSIHFKYIFKTRI